MDNVLNNDESVKFYTSLPTETGSMAIFNILKPLAEKLKYWDSNKGNKTNFQKKPCDKKSGKKPEKSGNCSGTPIGRLYHF